MGITLGFVDKKGEQHGRTPILLGLWYSREATIQVWMRSVPGRGPAGVIRTWWDDLVTFGL